MPKPLLAPILAGVLCLAAWCAAGPAQAGACLERGLWPPATETMSLHPAGAPKKAIDLSWPAQGAPSVLSLWTAHGGANQRWVIYMGLSAKLPSSFLIKSAAEPRCLVWGRPVPVLSERLHTVRCDSENPAQRWCVTGAGDGAVHIRHLPGGGCLTADGNLAQEGVPLTLKPCRNAPEQRWLVR
ncbi:MAG: RICIN domain-containing protein [Pseudomonadota bacterium]